MWDAVSDVMPGIDPELGKEDCVDLAGGHAWRTLRAQAMDVSTHAKWSATLAMVAGGEIPR